MGSEKMGKGRLGRKGRIEGHGIMVMNYSHLPTFQLFCAVSSSLDASRANLKHPLNRYSRSLNDFRIKRNFVATQVAALIQCFQAIQYFTKGYFCHMRTSHRARCPKLDGWELLGEVGGQFTLRSNKGTFQSFFYYPLGNVLPYLACAAIKICLLEYIWPAFPVCVEYPLGMAFRHFKQLSYCQKI